MNASTIVGAVVLFGSLVAASAAVSMEREEEWHVEEFRCAGIEHEIPADVGQVQVAFQPFLKTVYVSASGTDIVQTSERCSLILRRSPRFGHK